MVMIATFPSPYPAFQSEECLSLEKVSYPQGTPMGDQQCPRLCCQVANGEDLKTRILYLLALTMPLTGFSIIKTDFLAFR